MTKLEHAFSKANIYFNHFIKAHDIKMVDRQFLCRLFCHGAAIIYANNQRGVDIIIPILMGTIPDPIFITAIFILVKNDAQIPDKLCIGLFKLMNSIDVRLFSKGSKGSRKLPPVVRIVFALASEISTVKAPDQPTHSSPRSDPGDDFTAYDLWIAGVSSQSSGVVPGDQAFDG